MTKYRIKNLNSTSQSYKNNEGQEVTFRPGEQKELKSRPPQSYSGWDVEMIEQTSKPKDQEYKEDEGGD